MKTISALVLASGFFVGCNYRSMKSGDLDVSKTTSATNYRAKYCEVFVDKVRLNSSSHGYLGATFYVKILPQRLDATIVKAGFYGQHSFIDPYGTPTVEPWTDYVGVGFLSSTDYFEIAPDAYNRFTLLTDYSSDHRFIGAFYVESARGTRYWANAEDGGNFELTYERFLPLRDGDESLGAVTSRHSLDIKNVPPTADKLPYFNPGRCR